MNNKVLTAEYKHFDNLIWQLPVWSTAIFLLAVTAVAYISQASFENLTASKALIEELPTIFCTLTLLICCVFQLATFNALIRFRDHQADYAPQDNDTFAPWWRSGQTWLQAAIIVEFCTLLYMTVVLHFSNAAMWLAIIALILMFWYSHHTYVSKRRA